MLPLKRRLEIPRKPPVSQTPLPFPLWARPGRSATGPADPASASFQAGAGLALVGLALSAGGPAAGVWLDRLALSAAASSLATAGRLEDEAQIRDARQLTRPGDDPGPPGRIYAFWRRLAGRPPSIDPADIIAAATLAGVRADPAFERVAEAAGAALASPAPALAAAADAAAACLELRPDFPALAPWTADAVLALRLRWPVAVPLLATGLGRSWTRLADPAECARAYARVAAEACDRQREIARRAETLLRVAGKLRAKGAPAVVAALCAADALTPARLPGGLSDRAGRRLFERLVRLGAVRELSGRDTFRIYGL